VALPEFTVGMALVFAIVVVALVLFAGEPVPIDITAIGVAVALMVLEPWTRVDPAAGLSGFSSTATITVLATFVLSAGVRATGVVQLLGERISTFTRDSERRQLLATIGVVGPVSGFINNTARLIPERIPPTEDLTEEFRVADYLTEVVVRDDSPHVGRTVREALAETEFDADVLQIIRGDDVFLEPLTRKTIRAGDVFLVHTDRDTLVQLADLDGLDLAPDATVTEDELDVSDAGQNLVEIVVPTGSSLVGESLASANFRDRYDATVLAFRRGSELIRQRMDSVKLRVGDSLLVQGTVDSVERLDANPDFIVVGEVDHHYRDASIPVTVGIVVAVVGLAALDVLPIVVSALAGAVATVVTRVIRPAELYDTVETSSSCSRASSRSASRFSAPAARSSSPNSCCSPAASSSPSRSPPPPRS
jgi:di/tricarboxylate transporter